VRALPFLIATFAVCISTGAWAQPNALTRPICLDTSDIDGTSIPDNHTIIFRMNNGVRWKNTLQAECPGLWIAGGFDYVIRGGTVCANEQSIRVHDMPATCSLGPFTRMDTK
jgi:hypothetical protein